MKFYPYERGWGTERVLWRLEVLAILKRGGDRKKWPPFGKGRGGGGGVAKIIILS